MNKQEEVFRILNRMLLKHDFAVVQKRLRDGLFADDKKRAAAAKAWEWAYKIKIYSALLFKFVAASAVVAGLAAAVVTIISFMKS